MQLSTWAERVLHGCTLTDKLTPLGRPLDSAPGEGVRVPSEPGRPPSLAFVDRHGGPTAPMRVALLDKPEGRGRVLHAFANHELLALELMALALLRWPDADPAFRRSLARTMEDEQRHLGQYVERMTTCGVELGEVPVSRFFWDMLAQAPDPATFMAGLSGVLEQANLDFSRFWQRGFAEAGDTETADVLAEVYRDEVRHVRTGWRWFARWREPTFESWAGALQFPLTPARARGPMFDREGRERAGLPARMIAEVEVAAHSKGRPPRILWFRPEIELDLVGRTPPAAVRELASDLAWLVSADAGPDDVVIASTAPPVSLRQRWREAGLVVPRFLATEAPLAEDFGGRPIGALEPWGWSPSVRRDLARLLHLSPAPPPPAPHLSSKAWWTERRGTLLADLDVIPATRCGRLLTDPDAPFPDGPWLAKAPLSASGQARIRGEGAPSSRQRTWLRRVLAEQGVVVLEPLWRRLVDVSVQGRVTASGVRVDGLTRFVTDAGGRYRGSWLGPWHRGLPSELQRFVHSAGVGDSLLSVGERVGRVLAEAGHRGPFGVDAMIVDDDGPALHGLVEVNPRWTLGRIAWALSRRVRRGVPAWLRLIPRRDLTGGAASWLERMDTERPITREAGLLTSGIVPLADPDSVRRVLPVLEVGAPTAA